MVKVCFVKIGNIGSAPLLEFLLDERAERNDVDVRVVSSGSKMVDEQADQIVEHALSFKPELVVFTTPNASLPVPKKVVESLAASKIPSIVVSDGPAKKAVKDIEERGLGYLIVEADAMIGARREFLDPAEMTLFNSDIIKVLAVTGVFNILRDEIDKVIDAVKKGQPPAMPRLIIDSEGAIKASGLSNPYAQAKAFAAFEAAKKVADLNVRGCFMIKEADRYVLTVAAAHELLRKAAELADEAREIEKDADAVLRTPHYDDGSRLEKRKLLETPK